MPSSDFSFKDVLTLNKFVTPVIMTVIYWILVVVAILTGLMLMTQSFFAGLLTVILAPLYVRILSEVMVLAFKVYGVLCEIRDQNKARGQ